MMKGIDVSNFQGNIDWAKAKADGIEFALIRAGWGKFMENQIDPEFEDNYAGAKANGILVGVYWFNYFIDVATAKEEAEAFLRVLNGKQVDLGLWADYEYASVDYSIGQGVKPTPALVRKMMAAFISVLVSNKYSAGVYTNNDFINRYFTKEFIDKQPLWLANWGDNIEETIEPTPTDFPTLRVWQYTSRGDVDGINSNGLDMNIYLGDVNAIKPEIISPISEVVLPPQEFNIGDKVIVNGVITGWGNGDGGSIAKNNETMYIVDIVNSNVYTNYIGVAISPLNARQGWTTPDKLTLTKTHEVVAPLEQTFNIGDKVIVNGIITGWGNGDGGELQKNNVTMYVVDIVDSGLYPYYIGLAMQPRGVRQGWSKPNILSK